MVFFEMCVIIGFMIKQNKFDGDLGGTILKKNQEYFKKIVALGLTMSMLGVTAYAEETTEVVDETVEVVEYISEQVTDVEAVDTAEQIEAEEVIEDDVLTFDEALSLVLENSASLSQIEKYQEYLQEQKSDVWDSYGSFGMPTSDYQQWVDSSVYAFKSSVYSITTDQTSSKLSEATLEITSELTLLNAFSTLFSTYESLESLEAMAVTTEISYAQSELKHSLGMMSDYDLQQAKVSLDSVYTSIAQLELSVESQFITLNNLLGFSVDERYAIENPFAFETYTIDDMDSFVTSAINDDLSIASYELDLETALFNKNYLSVTTTTSQTDLYNYQYDVAKLNLKTAKTSKEESIRSAYVTLQQIEVNYNSALTDLAQAEKDYALAEVNYTIGNITKLALEQSELAVVQAENTVQSYIRSYAVQTYMLENTTVL